MTGNAFQVAAVWRLRNESVDDLGAGLLKTLDALTTLCPFCEDWEILDHSQPRYGPEEMLIASVPLRQARDRMADFVRYAVSRDDDDQPDPKGGYRLSAGNNQDNPSKIIEASCRGAYVNLGMRTSSAGFHTAYSTTPDPTITAYPVIRSILKAYVQIWKPDYAVATTSELIEHERPLRAIFDGTWMIYLSAPLAKRINRTDKVPIVQVADGGVYLIAAEETFDIANPAHRAGAIAIRETVAPLNR